MRLPPAVMWIDPGKMTGIAVLQGDRLFTADEWDFDHAGDQIEHWCAYWQRLLAVGWERYWVDQRRPQQDAHHALEMIGVARRYARKWQCQLLPERQPHDPDAADRKRLIAMGIWPPGKKDAQSAAVHMVGWLLETGNLPPPWRAGMSDGVSTL